MKGKKRFCVLWVLLLCTLLWCGGARAEGAKGVLTMEDVIRLSEKGEALTAADFEGYAGVVYGMNDSAVRYEIEGGYRLEIEKSLSMMRLFYTDIDRCCIDIRYFDVEEFVNCEDKSKYVAYTQPMSMDELLRLAALGDALRQEHLMHFADTYSYLEFSNEGEVSYVSEIVPADGYILHIADDNLAGTGAPMRAWLMKKHAPEYYIDIREGNVAEFIESTAEIPQKPKMTMDDVIALSEKGTALSWDDLTGYRGKYEVSFSIGAEYPVDDKYVLKVHASDWNAPVRSATFTTAGVYSPYYVDIRVESAEEFINAEDKSLYADYFQRISREDVLKLSEQGDTLIWSSFRRFRPDAAFYKMYGYVGDADVVNQFVIDDTFSLLIGQTAPNQELVFARLALNADPDEYVDIRTGDVSAFFARYDTEETRFTGRMTEENVRYIYRLGRMMSPESFEKYGAKNIAAAEGFAVYRYEVGDSHILLVNIATAKEAGSSRKAYLISRENEDDYADLWQSSEDVLNRLKELEQAQEIPATEPKYDGLG